MSDISSGSIDINLHTGDDGSGRGPDGDMKVVIETLRNVQQGVASISQNVRAILETLRTIARNGSMASSRGAAAAAVAAAASVRSQRVTVEKRPAYDPRKALALRSDFPNFSWSESGEISSPIADELRRRRSAEADAESRYLPPTTALALYAANQAREAQGLARVSRFSARPSTAMFSLGPGIGITRLRDPFLLPPGDPAQNNSLAVIRQAQAGAGGAGGSPPGSPPPQPPPPPSDSRGNGFGDIFRSIGRVLATLSLIGQAIKTVIAMIKFFPQMAQKQRSEFARVDPVIAQYQAQSMIAGLRDRIIMARDPGVRAAYAGFTQSEMAFLESTRAIRSDASKFVAGMGTSVYGYLGGLGLAYEGLMEGNLSKITTGFDVFNMFTGGTAYKAYMAGRLAAQGNTIRSLFIGDLVGMTGGRFSTSVAYPGRQAGEAWWNARP
jgi:hypothetical protein